MAGSNLDSYTEEQKLDLVVSLLTAVHVLTAVEALALGAKASLNLDTLTELIAGAAGDSYALRSVGTELVGYGSTDSIGTLDDLLAKTSEVVSIARDLKLPLPLLTVAEQLLIAAKGQSGGKTSAAVAVAKLWESFGGEKIKSSQAGALTGLDAEGTPSRVGFIGLGAMGFGMAKSIVKAGIPCLGYDAYPPSLEKFVAIGGKAAASLVEVATGTDVLVLMVVNSQQVEDVLFGEKGVGHLLAPGAAVVVSSTVPPSAAKVINEKLSLLPNKPIMVDAPVSGGAARAANGDLTIMASGEAAGLKKAGTVLDACTKTAGGADKRLFFFSGGVGFGSYVKLAHQNLAGVHVAVAAESMAFATKIGLNLRTTFQHVKASKGSSWMYINRMARLVEGDATCLSAIDILVKDIGIVVSEAALLGTPVFMSSTAFYPYIYLSSSGKGRDDDTTIVKIYEPLGLIAHKKW